MIRTLKVGLFTLFLASFSPNRAALAESPAEWAKTNIDSLVEIYRDFHRNPELSFEESKTADRLAKRLREISADVTMNVGGHGVVAFFKNGSGPTLMLRTDLDGLPVTEQTELVYVSTVKTKNTEGVEVGVMHACGHDIHMTNLVGVAQYLAANKADWSGTVMFIGQPAEERGAGAQAMLSDGLFERFTKPDFALALHVDANLEAGKIGYRSGYSLANVDSIDVTMKGRGGHGAYPHTTIDPVVQGAQLVVNLQTIVSREVKPIEPAVITVGSIHGGTKHNVIGDSCHLQITVRSYSDEVRNQLHSAIKRKANAVAMGAGAPEPEITISEGTPSLWNDLDLVEQMVPVFKRALGEDNVVESEPSMGGEDFSQYGRAGVPILMFQLGTVEQSRLARYKQIGIPAPSLHSSKYYPDAEQSLVTGVTAMASAALEILQSDDSN
jgi:hippurate hydrolase